MATRWEKVRVSVSERAPAVNVRGISGVICGRACEGRIDKRMLGSKERAIPADNGPSCALVSLMGA